MLHFSDWIRQGQSESDVFFLYTDSHIWAKQLFSTPNSMHKDMLPAFSIPLVLYRGYRILSSYILKIFFTEWITYGNLQVATEMLQTKARVG